MNNQEIVEAYMRLHLNTCRKHGVRLTKEDINRAEQEAAAMAQSGDLTEADLVPTKHDITLIRFQKLDVYISPIEL